MSKIDTLSTISIITVQIYKVYIFYSQKSVEKFIKTYDYYLNYPHSHSSHFFIHCIFHTLSTELSTLFKVNNSHVGTKMFPCWDQNSPTLGLY